MLTSFKNIISHTNPSTTSLVPKRPVALNASEFRADSIGRPKTFLDVHVNGHYLITVTVTHAATPNLTGTESLERLIEMDATIVTVWDKISGHTQNRSSFSQTLLDLTPQNFARSILPYIPQHITDAASPMECWIMWTVLASFEEIQGPTRNISTRPAEDRSINFVKCVLNLLNYYHLRQKYGIAYNEIGWAPRPATSLVAYFYHPDSTARTCHHAKDPYYGGNRLYGAASKPLQNLINILGDGPRTIVDDIIYEVFARTLIVLSSRSAYPIAGTLADTSTALTNGWLALARGAQTERHTGTMLSTEARSAIQNRPNPFMSINNCTTTVWKFANGFPYILSMWCMELCKIRTNADELHYLLLRDMLSVSTSEEDAAKALLIFSIRKGARGIYDLEEFNLGMQRALDAIFPKTLGFAPMFRAHNSAPTNVASKVFDEAVKGLPEDVMNKALSVLGAATSTAS